MLDKLGKLLRALSGERAAESRIRVLYTSSTQIGPGPAAVESLNWETGPPPGAAAAERFSAAGAALAAKLPENPLDSPAMLELSHLLLNEPPEEMERLNAEYAALRERFLRWQSGVRAFDAQGFPREEEHRRLTRELTEIEEAVAALEQRSREAQGLTDAAVRDAEAAAQAILETRGAGPSPEVAARLELAERRIEEARAALTAGAERPASAARLAAEARTLALAAREETQLARALPGEMERRRERFAERLDAVGRQIDEAKSALAAAAPDYPPACWHEIRGAGTAAEQAHRRAVQLWSATSGDVATGAGSPAEALAELEAPFAALDEASAHARAITEHIARLQAASAGARGAIERAEAAIDRGWAATAGGASGGKEVLERAGGLVAEARAQLAASQPDPLAVLALAERARGLAEMAGGGAPAAPVADGSATADSEGARQVLQAVMTRAKANRDRALALSWTTSAGSLSSSTSMLINRAEQAYQQAVLQEAAIARAGSGAPLTQAIVEATAAFRTADELAAAAYEAGWREINAPRRRPRPDDVETATGALIAGAAASVIFEIFGNQ